MASSLLAVAAELGTPPETVAGSWTLLRGIAARVAARRRDGGGDLAGALNQVVMGELAFEREVDHDRDNLAFMLLPPVVDGRRGSCVGLGALYLALAEILGEPLEGVMVPGHFYVRAPGNPPRNIELLRRGEAMPDDWYRKKYGPWPAAAAYGRALAPLEIEAIHWFNAGNLRRAAGDLSGAEDAFARAAADFPEMAEAHASLGVTRQLRGALDAAAEAYRAAARAWPDLPGLTRNVTLLEREQAGAAAHDESTPAGSPSIR
jgi:regulator of sirC expression with transglutaminase-like and TPR domain